MKRSSKRRKNWYHLPLSSGENLYLGIFLFPPLPMRRGLWLIWKDKLLKLFLKHKVCSRKVKAAHSSSCNRAWNTRERGNFPAVNQCYFQLLIYVLLLHMSLSHSQHICGFSLFKLLCALGLSCGCYPVNTWRVANGRVCSVQFGVLLKQRAWRHLWLSLWNPLSHLDSIVQSSGIKSAQNLTKLG